MKPIMMAWLCWLMLPVLVSANYLEKTSIEKSIQEKSQHVLDTMYGANHFSVSVSVAMGNESWLVDYTERADVDFRQTKNTPSETYQILPGYSAIKNLAPNEAVQLPFNSKVTKVPASIIRITLDIITSSAINRQDVKSADKVLTKLLQLDAERGDAIQFVFEDFPINKAEKVELGLPFEAKLMIFAIILTSVFVISYILLKIKQINVNKEAVKAQLDTAKATASAAKSSSVDTPPTSTEGSPVLPSVGESDTSGYFGFVGAHNYRQFIDVVVKRTLSVDHLAIVMSYIPPMYAKALVEALDDTNQQSVIAALTSEKVVPKEDLQAIESDLRQQLECTIGGAGVIGGVISLVDDALKATFLESIKHIPDVYQTVRPMTLLFNDIDYLEDADVKKLMGALPIEILATAIANDDTAVVKKITVNLTSAAQAMVNQFIDLKKSLLTSSEINQARQQVVRVMKELNDNGTIDVASKVIN